MRQAGKRLREFLTELKRAWKEQQVSNAAGALTFFIVLALFPFLIFLVALAGLLINPEIEAAMLEELARVAPAQVVDILGARLRDLVESSTGGLLTVSGLAAIWAASGGVAALTKALNIVYGVRESRPFWKVRGLALLVTLGGAVLSILASVVMVVVPAVAGRLGEPWSSLAEWLRLPVAGLLVMGLWAVLYWLLPNVQHRFRFFTLGSVLGVIVWLLISWGFSQYVAHFGRYEATYGALGGAIVFLLWLWISAQALLLGAEINALLERRQQAPRAAERPRAPPPVTPPPTARPARA